MRWDDVSYGTLAEFTAATGQESHGLSLPPGFADPAHGTYTLRPESPLIDAGGLVPGIDDDYAGTAPDLGAFEYAPSVYLPVVLRNSAP